MLTSGTAQTNVVTNTAKHTQTSLQETPPQEAYPFALFCTRSQHTRCAFAQLDTNQETAQDQCSTHGLSRVRRLQALAKIPLATRQRCTAGTADMHACRASLRTLRSREAPRSEATRERVHDARTTPVAEPPRGGRQLSHQGLDTALLGIASKALICTPSPAHLDGLQLTTFEQQVMTGTPVA